MLTIAVVALVAIAVANRVKTTRDLINPPPAA